MQRLYSDFIFHFTKSHESLINIFQTGFRYTRNPVPEIVTRKVKYTYQPDMICFTDIPLVQMARHSLDYGKFGIGMKKDWANKVGGQPVVYISKKSHYYKSLKRGNSGLEKLANLYASLPDDHALDEIIDEIKNDFFLAFDGLHSVSQQYSDYSEREWRIVRDERNRYQHANLEFAAQYETLKFSSSDVVLLVAPQQYIPKIIRSLESIVSERSEGIEFPIIPFEYLIRL